MIGNVKECVEWLLTQDREKRFELMEYHPKRSLNANAYCWALIGKIADYLRTDKDSVYLSMLKRYGQSQIVSVLSSIPVSGYFKYFEEAGRARLGEKEFTHYKVYKGSSEYDSREMSVLIDGIISEAREMGIETLPAKEIERIKSLWNPS